MALLNLRSVLDSFLPKEILPFPQKVLPLYLTQNIQVSTIKSLIEKQRSILTDNLMISNFTRKNFNLFFKLRRTKILFFAGYFLFFLIIGVNCATQKKVETEREKSQEEKRTSRTTNEEDTSESEERKTTENKATDNQNEYEAGLERAQSSGDKSTKNIENGGHSTHSEERETTETDGNAYTKQKNDYTDTELLSHEEIGELAELERELNDSLAAFDDMLLKERDEIRAKAENRKAGSLEDSERTNGAEESTGDTEHSTATGDEDASGSSGGSDSQGGGSEKKGEDQESFGSGTDYGDTGGSSPDFSQGEGKHDSDGSAGSGYGGRHTDESAQDDDIVARQLREAAENETDPVLKEKLWKEYEDYKRE